MPPWGGPPRCTAPGPPPSPAGSSRSPGPSSSPRRRGAGDAGSFRQLRAAEGVLQAEAELDMAPVLLVVVAIGRHRQVRQRQEALESQVIAESGGGAERVRRGVQVVSASQAQDDAHLPFGAEPREPSPARLAGQKIIEEVQVDPAVDEREP